MEDTLAESESINRQMMGMGGGGGGGTVPVIRSWGEHKRIAEHPLQYFHIYFFCIVFCLKETGHNQNSWFFLFFKKDDSKFWFLEILFKYLICLKTPKEILITEMSANPSEVSLICVAWILSV